MTANPDFPALLRAAIEREGLRGFARRAGVSAPFVARVRDGQSAPGPKLLAALGWERVVTYRPIVWAPPSPFGPHPEFDP